MRASEQDVDVTSHKTLIEDEDDDIGKSPANTTARSVVADF